MSSTLNHSSRLVNSSNPMDSNFQRVSTRSSRHVNSAQTRCPSQEMLIGAALPHVLLCHWTQELPEKWKSLRKIAFTVKHEVAPLQSNEVSVIRRKCVRFEVRLSVSEVGCQAFSPYKELDIGYIKHPISFPALYMSWLYLSSLFLGEAAWVQGTFSCRVDL